METAYLTIDGKLDKYIYIYTQWNATQPEKGWDTAIYNNVGDGWSWEHYLSEISQLEKDQNHMILLICRL